MNPSVSVIIPVFNRQQLIRETLKSVLVQTYTDMEVIVMDDGSTDGTADVVKEMAAGDARLRCLSQSNRGPAAARNAAIRNARGEWIAILDSDDLWHPDKLAAQLEAAAAHPEVDFLYCAGTVIDDHGNPLPERTAELCPDRLYTAEKILFEHVRLFTSGVLFRRKCLEKSGVFDERLKFFEDVDLWFRILLFYKGYFIDRDLVRKREHDRSYAATQSTRPQVEMYRCILDFLDSACGLFEKHVRALTNRERRVIYGRYRPNLISESLAAGLQTEARREALIHFKSHPFSGARYYLLTLLPRGLAEFLIEKRRERFSGGSAAARVVTRGDLPRR